MRTEIEEHLRKKLIPFWAGLQDEENGGFYGYVDRGLVADKEADKGCILMSRITWFFSNAYRTLGNPALLAQARHGYEFLRDHCFDREYGGIYWSVTFRGEPSDTIKHTYNQAFAIYALSSYFAASGDPEALDRALDLFHLVEDRMKDEGGYLEAFDMRFQPSSNEKLSENGVEAVRSMNTHLHVMEAYTELLRVLTEKKPAVRESERRAVRQALCGVCRIFTEKMWNPALGRVEVFFDHEWKSLIDLWSSGHDIESSWLADRAADILTAGAFSEEEKQAAADISRKIHAATEVMARQVYEKAFVRDSVVTEFENGIPAPGRVWWVQAETVVGFLNAYGKNPDRKEYLEAAEKTWDFIRNRFVDQREGAEWFWDLKEDFLPTDKPIVEPWKCPYHNGRMCFEVMERLKGDM